MVGAVVVAFEPVVEPAQVDAVGVDGRAGRAEAEEELAGYFAKGPVMPGADDETLAASGRGVLCLRLRIPAKLRRVPSRKMSCQPPMCRAGVVMCG